MAERLGKALQKLVHQFESDRYLKQKKLQFGAFFVYEYIFYSNTQYKPQKTMVAPVEVTPYKM